MPKKPKSHGFRSGGGGGNNSLIITVTNYSPNSAYNCLLCKMLHCLAEEMHSLSRDQNVTSKCM